MEVKVVFSIRCDWLLNMTRPVPVGRSTAPPVIDTFGPFRASRPLAISMVPVFSKVPW